MSSRDITVTLLVTLITLALVVVTDAAAESNRSKLRTGRQVQACVSEIGNHANYRDAAKVTHWITALNPVDIANLSIRIETTVYLANGGTAARQYTTSCVTGVTGDLVRFRIEAAGPRSASSPANPGESGQSPPRVHPA